MTDKVGKANVVGSQYARERDFWLSKLAGDLNKVGFPFDHISNEGEYESKIVEFTFSTEISSRINKISKGSNSKTYMILVAAVVSLLKKISGIDDIIIGAPIFRQEIEAEFVNTVLVLRHNLDQKRSFKDLILHVREVLKGATEHQNYPIDSLLYQLDMKFSQNKFPLFDVVVMLENVQNQNYIAHINPSLFFSFITEENLIKCTLKYNALLYQESTIHMIGTYLENLLNHALTHLDAPLLEIKILSEIEEKKILSDFNQTDTIVQVDKTIHQLFEEQVAKTPTEIAVIFEEQSFTYQELNKKANQIAREIRKKDIESEIVAILVERSIEMIIGMLAILKSGNAYLPIDYGYPKERIKYLLNDSKAKILLTQENLFDDLEYSGCIINLKHDTQYEHEDSNLGIGDKDDLAYIIYTSGTSGEPKGVAVEHHSIVNTLCWRKNYYGFDTEDSVLQIPSYCFDSSVEDIFTPLISGSKLALIRQEKRLDLDYQKDIIDKNLVTHFLITPTLYRTFLDEISDSLTTFRTVTLAGEGFSIELVNEHFSKLSHVRLFNEYGPTENSVCSTVHELTPEDVEITIGRPIANVKCYILNADGNICPIGIPGELCLSGKSLAKGYLNRPDLTEEKFVSNPFIKSFDPALARMYKTGDLAKWLPDGNIEFIGRIDFQVKVRGFRIELGEVENKIATIDLIKDVIVVAINEDDGRKSLCAYYLAEGDISPSDIRYQLAHVLPEYMIPTYFIRMEKMPLNNSGKIDRKALPDPKKGVGNTTEYIAPRNEIEEKLAEVCQSVLGVEKIGIYDDFFELGGDSIKTIQIASRLLKYGLKIETKDMFEFPTIAELSLLVKSNFKQVEQGSVIGEVLLTPIQKWFFGKEFAELHHWNQSILIHRATGFDIEVLDKVFVKIVEHHDALRMSYKVENDEIQQYNRDVEGDFFSIEVVDLQNAGVDYAAALEVKAHKFQAGLNLSTGPLVRGGLFKTVDGDYLLIAIHHLVVDGVSWRILLEDLSIGYHQAESGEEVTFQYKTNSYKDWAESIYKYANSKELLSELDYWREVECTDIAKLPKDHESIKSLNKHTLSLEMSLDEVVTSKLLKDTNRAYNTRINEILVTALGLAVKDWTNENKVLINLEGHGRENIDPGIDVSRTVGWFTVDYPVVLDMNYSNLSYSIKSIKEHLRRVPMNGIGYGVLKYITSPENKESLCFNLKPEIGFNYLGQFDEVVDSKVFCPSSLPTGYTMSPNAERMVSIEINSMVINRKFTLSLNYCDLEYDYATMEVFLNYFKNNLIEIIEHCLNKEGVELTPTDLGDKDLSLDELDDILEMVDHL